MFLIIVENKIIKNPRIQSINYKQFAGLSTLENLNLSNNRLKSIDQNVTDQITECYMVSCFQN